MSVIGTPMTGLTGYQQMQVWSAKRADAADDYRTNMESLTAGLTGSTTFAATQHRTTLPRTPLIPRTEPTLMLEIRPPDHTDRADVGGISLHVCRQTPGAMIVAGRGLQHAPTVIWQQATPRCRPCPRHPRRDGEEGKEAT